MQNGTLTIYGTDTCEGTARSRELLDRRGIPYSYINIDADKNASEQVRQWNDGQRITPTIVFPDGRRLVEPSDAEMEQAVRAEGHVTPG